MLFAEGNQLTNFGLLPFVNMNSPRSIKFRHIKTITGQLWRW